MRAFTAACIITRRGAGLGAGRLRYCRPMRRQPRVLYGVVFLDALLMFAIVPLLPAYVHDLHLTKTEVGLVVGIYSGAVLVGSLPVGYLAARVGARGLTIFGVGLLAAATFGCAFAGGFWALLAARTGCIEVRPVRDIASVRERVFAGHAAVPQKA